MNLILKYKNDLLLILGILLTYFFLRLIFIGNLPIFTDEAIYVRWTQIALNDSSWRFISLTDGKQPMFIWIALVFMKFINDPLVAVRLTSVLSGFFTLIGLWFLTKELFKSKKSAYLAAILYVFYPFAQVLDRMALYDSMVAAFFVWSTYFSILLLKYKRLDLAYTLGFIIGGGILTKTANFFSIYLLPFLLILLNFKDKLFLKEVIRFAFLAIFASAVAFGLYNILRLSPLFQMIEAKNAIFVYPFREWIEHPFTFFVGNLYGLFSWLIEYLKLPYILLILISLIYFKKFTKEKILLILYFILPLTALALFGKVIFPRFIFFMSLMLIPLAAVGLEHLILFLEKKVKVKINKNIYTIVLTFAFVIYSAFISVNFTLDPVNAKIARADSNQYINSWAAGWGVKESVRFFENQAKDKKIFIGTQGTFGLMPFAMEIYLVANKNITIKGYWPLENIPDEAIELSKKMPVYFIYYQKEFQEMPESFPLKLIFEVKQGRKNTYYRVYQLIP